MFFAAPEGSGLQFGGGGAAGALPVDPSQHVWSRATTASSSYRQTKTPTDEGSSAQIRKRDPQSQQGELQLSAGENQNNLPLEEAEEDDGSSDDPEEAASHWAHVYHLDIYGWSWYLVLYFMFGWMSILPLLAGDPGSNYVTEFRARMWEGGGVPTSGRSSISSFYDDVLRAVQSSRTGGGVLPSSLTAITSVSASPLTPTTAPAHQSANPLWQIVIRLAGACFVVAGGIRNRLSVPRKGTPERECIKVLGTLVYLTRHGNGVLTWHLLVTAALEFYLYFFPYTATSVTPVSISVIHAIATDASIMVATLGTMVTLLWAALVLPSAQVQKYYENTKRKMGVDARWRDILNHAAGLPLGLFDMLSRRRSSGPAVEDVPKVETTSALDFERVPLLLLVFTVYYFVMLYANFLMTNAWPYGVIKYVHSGGFLKGWLPFILFVYAAALLVVGFFWCVVRL
eukprot:CAMPEP_0178988432 /NCGR_PEP_ID=MMETSP0795-20121207/3808_1 /TAXON_ID=88552 /ORGANISM="Amoebophrya sp., Strain Ameob2" /LENGTH=455 /DNA_ID=CAMNT_0020679707 /DNA_START=374 /DNA_END=1741 /DNA_ORIENTATION=+